MGYGKCIFLLFLQRRNKDHCLKRNNFVRRRKSSEYEGVLPRNYCIDTVHVQDADPVENMSLTETQSIQYY